MNTHSGLRTVFFGTTEFAAHILEYLLEHGEQIVGVVTAPAKPQGRGLKIRGSAVAEVAQQHSLPTLTPIKLRDPEFRASLERLGADCFCVVAYRILPREIFTLPKIGSFNIHASLLPKYRGAAPINWAIIRGEHESGITTFLLDDAVDTGGVLLSEAIPIGPDETAGELHDALMKLGARIALKTLHGLAEGTLSPKIQSNREATSAPKIFPKDCVIDFSDSAANVHNFIRGLSPHPGAVAIQNGVRLKVLRARIETLPSHEIPIGVFRYSEDGRRLFVGTSTSAIEILELQREGRSAMQTEVFLRGSKSLFDV